MRKLASIQIIKEKSLIENADAIELVKILGWNVVTKKDEFKIGEKCVYCEIDSILPEKPEFEFLRKTKFRIRTCKLRGKISQGICFPINILPVDTYEIDQDVSDILGVTKYEPIIPENLVGKVRSTFPTHLLPKTDETRVQVLEEVLNKYEKTVCYVSEKVDGTSATYIFHENEFFVCSRNQMLMNNDINSYCEIAIKYNLEKKLATLGKNIAIQGEIIGEGIVIRPLKEIMDFEYDRISFKVINPNFLLKYE